MNVIVVVLSGIMQSFAFFIVMLCDDIMVIVVMQSVVKSSVVSPRVVAPTGERKKLSFEKEGGGDFNGVLASESPLKTFLKIWRKT